MSIQDAAQRAESLRLDQHVLAVAPAGSGKTGLLVRRALRALATVDQPEAVLAITFTNKAAAEIRSRMLGALRMAAAGEAPTEGFQRGLYDDACDALAQDARQGWGLLDNPARINATTIDAFNQRLASQLPLLSGLGGRASVADAPQALYEAAAARAFAQVDSGDTSDEDRTALLAILDWANNRLDSAIPAIADLLSRRDQWLAYRPQLLAGPAHDEEVLAEAVSAILDTVKSALPQAQSGAIIHALADGATQDEQLVWAAGLGAWPDTLPADLPLWRRLVDVVLVKDRNKVKFRSSVNKNDGFPPKADYKPAFVAALKTLAEDHAPLARQLDAIRDLPNPVFPADYATLRTHLGRVLTLAVGELLVEFAESGQLDYAQIAMAARQAASGEAGPEALRRSDLELRHLLVDEMQDTSDTQIDLLTNLTSDWEPGDGRSLFIVGDPQQSIYAFRKADVRLFQQLIDTRVLGHLPLSVQRLSTNFRSHAALVDWFNAELSRPFPAQADLWSGAVRYNPADTGPGKPTGDGVNVLPIPEKNAIAEAATAAFRIADLLADLQPGETIGLLGAARGHLTPVLARLAAMGVDGVQATDLITLESCRPASDFVQLVRALRQPEDRLAWAAMLRAPFVGMAWADLLAISRGNLTRAWPQRIRFALDERPEQLSDDGWLRLQRLSDRLAQVESLRGNLADATWALWNGLGGPACIDNPGDADAVALALRCIRVHQSGGEIEDWSVLQAALNTLYRPPGSGPIQAMTIHKSKGLQFDHVVLVGCGRQPRNEDRPPLHLLSLQHGALLAPKPAESMDDASDAGAGDYAQGSDIYNFAHGLHVQASRNERLRVLYVAATRAVQSLTLVVEAKHSDKDGWKPAKHSFADLLWTSMAPTFDALEPPEDMDDHDNVEIGPAPLPPRERLPADFSATFEMPSWYPQERRTLRPSEQVLTQSDEADTPELDAGDLYAQLVGTLYHEAIERVVTTGVEGWNAEAAVGPMSSGLRRMGMPEDRVDAAVQRILLLVEQTLNDASGRWVLAGESAERPWARNEYPLAGWQDGQWVSAIIDRCFEQIEADKTTLWIIDYKAAAYPVDDADTYANHAVQKYASQLRHYAGLLGSLRGTLRVKTGLYLPAIQRLIEVPADNRSREPVEEDGFLPAQE